MIPGGNTKPYQMFTPFEDSIVSCNIFIRVFLCPAGALLGISGLNNPFSQESLEIHFFKISYLKSFWVPSIRVRFYSQCSYSLGNMLVHICENNKTMLKVTCYYNFKVKFILFTCVMHNMFKFKQKCVCDMWLLICSKKKYI